MCLVRSCDFASTIASFSYKPCSKLRSHAAGVPETPTAASESETSEVPPSDASEQSAADGKLEKLHLSRVHAMSVASLAVAEPEVPSVQQKPSGRRLAVRTAVADSANELASTSNPKPNLSM